MSAMETSNPNSRLTRIIDYAIREVTDRLHDRNEFDEWLKWASSWNDGTRSPNVCVETARRCFQKKEFPIYHCLGQLAWAAKEACYDTPKSGWLVIRYVADAMIAFGVAFPAEPIAPLQFSLDRPLRTEIDALQHTPTKELTP